MPEIRVDFDLFVTFEDGFIVPFYLHRFTFKDCKRFVEYLSKAPCVEEITVKMR